MATSKKNKKDKKKSQYRAASNNPIVKPFLESINQLANGDKAVGQGLLGGANLGAELYAPGSLGRLDENILGDPDVSSLLDGARSQFKEGVSPELMDSLSAARNAVSASDINSAPNQEILNMLRGQTTISPDQQRALELLRGRAETAGNLTSLESELLDLRRAGLGGMGSKELTALKEGGGYDAQGNFVPGLAEIQRAAKSALTSMQGTNLVAGGPRGRSNLVNSLPIVQNVLDQTGALQRKLVLDEYNSKLQAENQLASSLGSVNAGVQDRINTSGVNYGTIANQTRDIQGKAISSMGDFVQGTNQNFVNATGNMGNIAGAVEQSRANRLQRFIDTVGSVRNEMLYTKTFNMNQIDRERAGMSSSIFGGGAFGASQAGRKEANDIAKKQLESAKSFGGGSNPWGTSSGNKNTGSTGSNGVTTSDSFDVSM